MKKLLIVSTIVLGTFAGIGGASALDSSSGYPTWAQDAFISGQSQLVFHAKHKF